MAENPQELIVEFQRLQEQFQNILIQKENAKLQILEIDKSLEELGNVKDDVYKASGMILIKSNPSKVSKELKETKENLELRIKSLEKQEKLVRDKLIEIQNKVTKGQTPSEAAE